MDGTSIDFGDLFRVTTVPVLSAIDGAKLEALLKWVVDRQQKEPGASDAQGVQDQIDALKKENESLREDASGLRRKLGDMEQALDTKLDKDQSIKPAGDGESKGAPAMDKQQASDLRGLADKLATVEAAQKALAYTCDELKRLLANKADRADLDSKANASELDALLKSGALSGSAAGPQGTTEDDAAAAAAPAPAVVSADGSVDAGALERALQCATDDLAALKAQMAVAQERIGAKADAASLDALRRDVDTWQTEGSNASTSSSAAPATAAAAAPAVASADAGAAIDAASSVEDLQPLLKGMYAQLGGKADRSFMDDILSRLAELARELEGKASLDDLNRLVPPTAGATSAPTTTRSKRNSIISRSSSQQQATGADTTVNTTAATVMPAAEDNNDDNNGDVKDDGNGGDGDNGDDDDVSSGPGHSRNLSGLRRALEALAARVAPLEAASVMFTSALSSSSSSSLPSSRPDNTGQYGQQHGQQQQQAVVLDAGSVVPEPSSAARVSERNGDGLGSEEEQQALKDGLARLAAQLADLARQGKADAERLISLELIINAKADVDELADLRGMLAAKADAATLTEVQMALSSKADASALDTIKLQLALAQQQAGAGNGDSSSTAAGDDGAAGEGTPATAANGGAMLEALQGLVADKATRAELEALRDALAGKASAEELAVLRQAMEANSGAAALEGMQRALAVKAPLADLDAIKQSLGDVFAELDALRSHLSRLQAAARASATGQIAAAPLPAAAAAAGAETEAARVGAPSPTAAAGNAAVPEGVVKALNALGQEVQALRDNLDTIAHAANILAVGMKDAAGTMGTSAAGAAAAAAGGHHPFANGEYNHPGFSPRTASAAAAGGPFDHAAFHGNGNVNASFDFGNANGNVGGNGNGGLGGAGFRSEGRSPRGAYERLVKLLGAGEYHKKMDAFDLEPLQLMANKLASLEATVKSPAMARAAGAPDLGMKELERQVKRLGTDVRLVKERMAESGMMVGSVRRDPGDHAMLAAKPIGGYRCLACDRPLEGLDMTPGPYIPTGQMPVPNTLPAGYIDASGIRMMMANGGGGGGGGGFAAAGNGGGGNGGGGTGGGSAAASTPPPRVSKPNGALTPESSSGALRRNNDPNVRSPQNWYQDAKGAPAELLPKQDVGPHLPPGGWRGAGPSPPVNSGAVSTTATAYIKGATPLLPSINSPPGGSPLRSPKISEPGFGVMNASTYPNAGGGPGAMLAAADALPPI